MQVQAYGAQVAGHQKTEGAKYIGLLQCNTGTILKPILKEAHRREIDFYERLRDTDNPDLIELREYVPKYQGYKKYTYNGYQNEYIILDDLTDKMLEPCIMDVKIGRRTWDPLASEEKIENEKSKYVLSRKEYAFCIPGFQVYRIPSGRLLKHGKEYGKKLQGQAVRDAIKSFLNGADSTICRTLLMQFLTELWKIQKWCTKQRSVRLYSASLLLVYDANRVRSCCGEATTRRSNTHKPGPVRRRSIHTMHSIIDSSFSGQLTSSGPHYRKLNSVPLSPMSLAQKSFELPPPCRSPWTEALDKLQQSHSFAHNYDDNVNKIKISYKAGLEMLSTDASPQHRGMVKLIDFTHAFFNDETNMTADDNFREGIDNFVAVLEELLGNT